MSLKDFYLRRIFRLYPALLFFLIIVVVFNIISGQKIIIPDVLSGLFYFTNYYLVYFKPAFLSSGYPLVSEILWSLSIGLALLSYYGVERTFLTLRRRFGSHAK